MSNKLLFLSIFILVAYRLEAQAQEPTPISRSLPQGVEVTRDIPYIHYQNRELLLDIYRPRNRQGEVLPTIVVIRGGGWAKGDKVGFGPMSAALAQRGFAAVCIEYRVSAEALFPAAVLDTKSAVSWIKKNADKYNFDPTAIGAIGGSAGAHLAMLVGVSAKIESLNPSKSSNDFGIHAVVGLATPADFSKNSGGEVIAKWLGKPYDKDKGLWQAASPTTYIDEDSPPILFIHSASDKVVPFEQSLMAVNLLGEHGVYSELVLLPDAPHAFWNFNEWFEETMDKAANFLHGQLDQ